MITRLLTALLLVSGPAIGRAQSPDFRAMVRDALQKGAHRVVIPPGVYRLAPVEGQRVIWTVNGAKDAQIVADGVTLIGTVLTRAVDFENCTDVTLQGLTVDYDPLPFTQGTIVSVGQDKNSVDVKIHAGYPVQPYSRIDVVDPATRYRKTGMPFLWGTTAVLVGSDVVRITRSGVGKIAAPGDYMSMSTGPDPKWGIPHAMTVSDCAQMTFRNVTIHSAPGMGLIESGGAGGSQYLGCNVTLGPKPAGATQDRLLTTSWDAMQSANIRKGPLVEGCVMEDAGDDSWSVQSSDYLVVSHEGNSLTILPRDPYTSGLEIGDAIRRSIDSPEAVVVSRKAIPFSHAGLSADVLDKLKTASKWSFWDVGRNCLVLTLDRDFSAAVGDSIFSPDRQGAGFIFRNNKLHSTGRVLIKAGDGVIEGNLLDEAWGLVVNPELPFPAAAGISNLVIRDNVIRRSGFFCPAPFLAQAGAISVTASGPRGHVRPAGVYDGIVIENNKIIGANGPNIVVSSALNVRISGNDFIDAQRTPPNDSGKNFGIANDCVVWVGASDHVRIAGNQITGIGPYVRKPVIIDPSAKDVTVSGLQTPGQ